MPRRPSSAEEISSTRESLLDTAQALLEEDGIEAMSFRAIANRAGCSHTKPYSYFGSKADIIDALRVRSYEWLLGVLSTAAALHDEPIAALQALSEAYVRAGLDRPRMYDLLYTDAGSIEESDPTLLTAKLAALGVCRDVIDAAEKAGTIELAVDPLTAAHTFWAGAHGLVELHLGGFFVVGRSIDDLLPVFVSTLILGLSKQNLAKEVAT